MWLLYPRVLGFLGSSDDKESSWNAGDLGLIPRLGRSPGGGHGNPLQCYCLENHHGQKSLAGYSPWGHKKSNMTEQLSAHNHGFSVRCMNSLKLFYFLETQFYDL